MATTTEIKRQLESAFNTKQAAVLTDVIVDSYKDLAKASDVKELKEDVGELKYIVKELAQSQIGLAQSQKRTDARLEELVESQKELAQSQKRTDARLEELGQSQKRTDARLEELAETQKKEFKSIRDQISALGSRWGIYNEAAFRATIKGLLEKQKGMTITRGHYGGREVDLVIRNGEHILLEITSRMKHDDIEKILASAEDYQNQHGIEPHLMVATNYISQKLMEKIYSLPLKIRIFSPEE